MSYIPKAERERLTALQDTLCALGFTPDESDALRRISRTLRRWHELECGIDAGCIERDDTTGKPRFLSYSGRRWPVRDMEAGALRRLAHIMQDANNRRFIGDAASMLAPNCDDLTHYVQPDPRGAALYILRPGDVPPGTDPASCYTRGICVY